MKSYAEDKFKRLFGKEGKKYLINYLGSLVEFILNSNHEHCVRIRTKPEIVGYRTILRHSSAINDYTSSIRCKLIIKLLDTYNIVDTEQEVDNDPFFFIPDTSTFEFGTYEYITVGSKQRLDSGYLIVHNGGCDLYLYTGKSKTPRSIYKGTVRSKITGNHKQICFEFRSRKIFSSKRSTSEYNTPTYIIIDTEYEHKEDQYNYLFGKYLSIEPTSGICVIRQISSDISEPKRSTTNPKFPAIVKAILRGSRADLSKETIPKYKNILKVIGTLNNSFLGFTLERVNKKANTTITSDYLHIFKIRIMDDYISFVSNNYGEVEAHLTYVNDRFLLFEHKKKQNLINGQMGTSPQSLSICLHKKITEEAGQKFYQGVYFLISDSFKPVCGKILIAVNDWTDPQPEYYEFSNKQDKIEELFQEFKFLHEFVTSKLNSYGDNTNLVSKYPYLSRNYEYLLNGYYKITRTEENFRITSCLYIKKNYKIIYRTYRLSRENLEFGKSDVSTYNIVEYLGTGNYSNPFLQINIKQRRRIKVINEKVEYYDYTPIVGNLIFSVGDVLDKNSIIDKNGHSLTTTVNGDLIPFKETITYISGNENMEPYPKIVTL